MKKTYMSVLYCILGALIISPVLVIIGLGMYASPSILNFNSDKAINIQCTGKVFETCHVYFSSQIEKPEEYVELRLRLHTATVGDRYYLHLAGNGGSADGEIAIINAIKDTSAKVISIVEGPVHSAHAYIAIAGHGLIVSPMSYFMFHHVNVYRSANLFCNRYVGSTDRSQSLYAKCVYYIIAGVGLADSVIDKYASKYLTKDEVKYIREGHDLYISGVEMKRRTEGKVKVSQVPPKAVQDRIKGSEDRLKKLIRSKK